VEPVIIHFQASSLGRIEFSVDVLKGDFKSFKAVRFKLDSGSDFTTVDCDDLYELGYTQDFLAKCPFHTTIASTASADIRLQYIKNISIKFDDREIQGCRIFFSQDKGTQLRSLFGCDILKYFNWEINYDKSILRLAYVENKPQLSEGETPLQIYTVEGD